MDLAQRLVSRIQEKQAEECLDENLKMSSRLGLSCSKHG